MQRLAFAMSTRPKFADKPWVMEAVNAVARELQFWYRRHSIRRYLARQTRHRLAATTLQCWKNPGNYVNRELETSLDAILDVTSGDEKDSNEGHAI